MKQVATLLSTTILFIPLHSAKAFQGFRFPNFKFGKQNQKVLTKSISVQKEEKLLDLVSYKKNGKAASKGEQQKILSVVRDMEKGFSAGSELFSDLQYLDLLDGTWYLQYTSPSVVQLDDETGVEGLSKEDVWSPTIAEDQRIETRQIEANGSISAAGFKVDVSNRVPKQIININDLTVINEVELDYGVVAVGGPFRVSDQVPNRVVVAFKKCNINLKAGLSLDLGWLFKFLSLFRGTEDSGWLEVTYLSEGVRIGRGNKGTMFVLTRDPDAVKP